MECSDRIHDADDSSSVLQALLMVTAVDITERKRMEAQLSAVERHTKFESLMADLATRCAATTPDRVEAVIREAIGEITETLGVERGAADTKDARQRAPGERHVMYRNATTGRADGAIASDSEAIRRVLAQVEQVAPTPATVLLLGETGVGKEVFAQAIHNLSPRQRRPMIRVSCAAIPTALIESELFGRERGAFTGALSRQIGRFEAAHGSTIFLDEIGDLPLEVQVKLLRVLQERTVERLGANESTKVDVRVIAATNKNLEQAVATNAFREDLFYRLNVFPITIPPLRERADDINALVWTFIDEFSQAFGKHIEAISQESLAALRAYSWPGNVRELRNVIERAVIMATSPTLVVAAPSPVSKTRRTSSSKLADIQAAHIASVLASCRWRIRGSGGAAERLGLRPTTLESRMSRLGISRDMGSAPGLARVGSPSPS
ncbi:MAG TPA: sigma 54-interacting transcriptional regulator [Vicinamibacterales bacterium]|nr:sigma 54-interacting transcriptional regulator [Vicinamibacterales bacterium]